MKRKTNFYLRSVAVFIATSLIYQSLSLPLAQAQMLKAPAVSQPTSFFDNTLNSFSSLQQTKLTIPESVGEIVESYAPEQSGRIVYHIQDVHGHVPAQINLSEMVNKLYSYSKAQNKKLVVAMEGTVGPINIDPLTAHNKDKKVKVASALLRGGYLFGEEYTAITQATGEIKLEGVESASLYKKNDIAEKRTVEARKEIYRVLSKIRKQLETLKPHNYNEKLAHLEANRLGLLNGTVSVMNHLKFMEKTAPEIFSRYPNLKQALSISSQESTIDFEKVQEESDRLVKEVIEIEDEKDVESMLADSKAMKAGELSAVVYYSKYLAKAKRSYPNLNRYVAYLKASSNIDADELFDDVEEVEVELARALVSHPIVGELYSHLRWVERQEKFLSLELIPSEWEKNKNTTPQTYFDRHEQITKFVNEQKEDIGYNLRVPSFNEDTLKLAVMGSRTYYRAANGRDDAMVKNLRKVLAKYPAEDYNVALVAGGFHTPGLTKEFKKYGLAYNVIRPQLEAGIHLDETYQLSSFNYYDSKISKQFNKRNPAPTAVAGSAIDHALAAPALPADANLTLAKALRSADQNGKRKVGPGGGGVPNWLLIFLAVLTTVGLILSQFGPTVEVEGARTVLAGGWAAALLGLSLIYRSRRIIQSKEHFDYNGAGISSNGRYVMTTYGNSTDEFQLFDVNSAEEIPVRAEDHIILERGRVDVSPDRERILFIDKKEGQILVKKVKDKAAVQLNVRKGVTDAAFLDEDRIVFIHKRTVNVFNLKTNRYEINRLTLPENSALISSVHVSADDNVYVVAGKKVFRSQNIDSETPSFEELFAGEIDFQKIAVAEEGHIVAYDGETLTYFDLDRPRERPIPINDAVGDVESFAVHGDEVVIGGSRGVIQTVRIDPEDFIFSTIIDAHDGPVIAVGFANVTDEKSDVVSVGDSSVKIWNAFSGQKQTEFLTPKQAAERVSVEGRVTTIERPAFTDNPTFVSVNLRGEIHVRRSGLEATRHDLNGQKLSIEPNFPILVNGFDQNDVVGISEDGQTIYVNVGGVGEQVKTTDVTDQKGQSVRLIGATSAKDGGIYGVDEDGNVHLIVKDMEGQRLRGLYTTQTIVSEREEAGYIVEFAFGEQSYALRNAEGTVEFFDYEGNHLAFGPNRNSRGLVYDEDRQTYYVADGPVVKRYSKRDSYSSAPVVHDNEDAVVTALGINSDDALVVGGEDGKIKLVNLEEQDGKPINLEGHSGAITSLAFPKSGLLVSGSIDGTAKIWKDMGPNYGEWFQLGLSIVTTVLGFYVRANEVVGLQWAGFGLIVIGALFGVVALITTAQKTVAIRNSTTGPASDLEPRNGAEAFIILLVQSLVGLFGLSLFVTNDANVIGEAPENGTDVVVNEFLLRASNPFQFLANLIAAPVVALHEVGHQLLRKIHPALAKSETLASVLGLVLSLTVAPFLVVGTLYRIQTAPAVSTDVGSINAGHSYAGMTVSAVVSSKAEDDNTVSSGKPDIQKAARTDVRRGPSVMMVDVDSVIEAHEGFTPGNLAELVNSAIAYYKNTQPTDGEAGEAHIVFETNIGWVRSFLSDRKGPVEGTSLNLALADARGLSFVVPGKVLDVAIQSGHVFHMGKNSTAPIGMKSVNVHHAVDLAIAMGVYARFMDPATVHEATVRAIVRHLKIRMEEYREIGTEVMGTLMSMLAA